MVSLRWSGEHTLICKGGVASCGVRPLHGGGGRINKIGIHRGGTNPNIGNTGWFSLYWLIILSTPCDSTLQLAGLFTISFFSTNWNTSSRVMFFGGITQYVKSNC